MKRVRVLLAAIPAAMFGITMLRKLMRREERSFTPVAPGEEREEPRSEGAMLTDVDASITPEQPEVPVGAESEATGEPEASGETA
jgi:hypothetical protein